MALIKSLLDNGAVPKVGRRDKDIFRIMWKKHYYKKATQLLVDVSVQDGREWSTWSLGSPHCSSSSSNRQDDVQKTELGNPSVTIDVHEYLIYKPEGLQEQKVANIEVAECLLYLRGSRLH